MDVIYNVVPYTVLSQRGSVFLLFLLETLRHRYSASQQLLAGHAAEELGGSRCQGEEPKGCREEEAERDHCRKEIPWKQQYDGNVHRKEGKDR